MNDQHCTITSSTCSSTAASGRERRGAATEDDPVVRRRVQESRVFRSAALLRRGKPLKVDAMLRPPARGWLGLGWGLAAMVIGLGTVVLSQDVAWADVARLLSMGR